MGSNFGAPFELLERLKAKDEVPKSDHGSVTFRSNWMLRHGLQIPTIWKTLYADDSELARLDEHPGSLAGGVLNECRTQTSALCRR